MIKPNLILVIDDENPVRRLLEITLQSQGYSFEEAINGTDGIHMAASHNPSLILLDLGLPDMDGHVVLKKIREWYTRPIIILSVRDEESNIVRAIDSGANDYITKPFRTGELLARIRSAIRQSQSDPGKTILESGDIVIDLANHTVKKNSELLKLTATEFSLLALLAKNAGRVLTHHYILKEIWGTGYQDQTQYLRVYVAQLRKKIEKNHDRPELLITESGIGYRFNDQGH